jgi:hypothetical protein
VCYFIKYVVQHVFECFIRVKYAFLGCNKGCFGVCWGDIWREMGEIVFFYEKIGK